MLFYQQYYYKYDYTHNSAQFALPSITSNYVKVSRFLVFLWTVRTILFLLVQGK